MLLEDGDGALPRVDPHPGPAIGSRVAGERQQGRRRADGRQRGKDPLAETNPSVIDVVDRAVHLARCRHLRHDRQSSAAPGHHNHLVTLGEMVVQPQSRLLAAACRRSPSKFRQALEQIQAVRHDATRASVGSCRSSCRARAPMRWRSA